MISACPIAAARDALTLLSTGRAGMALRVLEALPSAIEAALKGAASEGYLQGQRVAHRMAAARRSSPALHKTGRLDELRAVLADPAKRAAVRSALRMDDTMLDRIAAGGVSLTPAQRRRIRETLG